MRPESNKIIEEILHYINRFAGADSLSSETDEAFNELALQLFRFQFQWNQPFKKYCQARRKSPLTVTKWQDIPPLPFQAFKELTLSCEPVEEAQAVFMTSGSTNPEKKGRHYHPTFRVWDASMAMPFHRYVMPDQEKMTIYVISPAEDVNQNSSLARYLSMAVQRYGREDSAFFFHKESGLDMEDLATRLKNCQMRDEPLLLMGATFSYVHFLDYCREHNLRFQLPKGSRIFDTGGLKGQSREVTAEELYGGFQEFFHVKRELCINMYGMTELCSQMYDRTIETYLSQGKPVFDKIGPAWIRTQILNSDTLEPLPDGETGIIAHYDLANWNSSLAILTEDIGYKTQHGFVLLGRAKGSESRGCSIAIDQMMQANSKVDERI